MVPGSRLSVTSVLRAATTTAAPAPASARAMYSPMPRLAPVTMATFPSSAAIGSAFRRPSSAKS